MTSVEKTMARLRAFTGQEGNLSRLARAAGVGKGALSYLVNRGMENPTLRNVAACERALDQIEAEPSASTPDRAA